MKLHIVPNEIVEMNQMRTNNAPTIRLEDYQRSAYTIDKVDLFFDLSAKATHVMSVISVRRMDHASVDAKLELVGDELTLQSIKLNGQLMNEGDYTSSPTELIIHNTPQSETFELSIGTELAPADNSKLMGLYQSNNIFCTQCEAEGFRRITYFLDRPDVLATYKVRIEALIKDCKHLLSNGNLVDCGTIDNDRHFAVWEDPHPKPSYLFALVAGNLDVCSDQFETSSGRNVGLNIFVETGKADQATYAMDALKRSMIWDENEYGCEYDLDVFNIVAVSDFNMGAMENKGLNVFNDKYVLANPDIATDADYANIEAIIAHEYFHNWTGNRITCRDWFQLCLKEGLTVFRDQEFSSDQRSRAVQRIQQVRTLKSSQFKEDAGPLAHPVRPQEYQEINNFYTATVYQKGAELVRMLATLVGPQTYRKATDLYFSRHDGMAATMEDFVKCFEDASGHNLEQFMRWYGQAGTPVLQVQEKWNSERGEYTLSLQQDTPPTPGQGTKQAVVIPVRYTLYNKIGEPIDGFSDHDSVSDELITLVDSSLEVVFSGLEEKPVVSLLQGFSAPVNLKFAESADNRLFRAKHDSDPYNRWEAINGFMLKELVGQSNGNGDCKFDGRLIEAMVSTVSDNTLDPAFRALAITLPSTGDIAREIGGNVNPQSILEAVTSFQKLFADALGNTGIEMVSALNDALATCSDAEAVGIRSLKNVILQTMVAGQPNDHCRLAFREYEKSTNMTDRFAALSALVLHGDDTVIADEASKQFFDRYHDNPLVLNAWFSLNSRLPGEKGLNRVKECLSHSAFSLDNPNRARSVLGPFASSNLTAFHHSSGEGYKIFCQHILKLDAINPQIAARLLTLMGDWRIYHKASSDKAFEQLEVLAKSGPLSRDLKEIVERSLA